MSRFAVEHAVSAAPLSQGDIRQPRVTDTLSGTVLLDLWSVGTWDYDGDLVREDGPVIELYVRRWPGTAHCTVVIDADARTYEVRDAVRPKRLTALLERLRAAGLAAAPD